MVVERGDLTRAVEDANVELVKELLQSCNSQKAVDDTDSKKNRTRTAFMAAARGNGYGGPDFGKILRLIWSRYKELRCNLNHILTQEGGQRYRSWTVLMHSARCGDADNLGIVLGFYEEVFGLNLAATPVKDMVDLVDVDSKVKAIVTDRFFPGLEVISNYEGRSRRTTSRRLATASSVSLVTPSRKREKRDGSPSRPAASRPNKTRSRVVQTSPLPTRASREGASLATSIEDHATSRAKENVRKAAPAQMEDERKPAARVAVKSEETSEETSHPAGSFDGDGASAEQVTSAPAVAAGAPGTVLTLLGELEQIVGGDGGGVTILDRLNRLDVLFFSSPQAGSIPERIQRLKRLIG